MSKLETNTIDTVSGTTNLTIGGANNTGSTTIKTNNTDAVTIDSSQNVGIGTSSPDHKVTITGSSNQGTLGLYSSGTSNELRFENDGSQNWVISNQSQGLRFKTAGTERMRIDSSGNLLFGTTTTSLNGSTGGSGILPQSDNRMMYISATTSTSNLVTFLFRNPNGDVGSIFTNGSSTSFNTSSDYRLKENVNYDFDATTRLKQLKPARFNFIADADTTVDGFIAHEVSSVVPEAISGEKDAVNEDGSIQPQGIDQSKLVPLLVKTIQELEARITELENK